MKTILILLTLLFFNTIVVKANDDRFQSDFNKWLFDNGHLKYVSKKENEICENETKFSQAWYLQKCDKFLLH